MYPLRIGSNGVCNACTCLDLLFDYLGLRLNELNAVGKDMVFNVRFPDTGQNYLLKLEHAVLDYWPDRQAKNADVTLELDRATLDQITLGQTSFDRAVTDGKMKIEGDAEKLGELLALLDDFELWYGVVSHKAPRHEHARRRESMTLLARLIAFSASLFAGSHGRSH